MTHLDAPQDHGQEEFIPAWWLPSPHLQTLWPTLARHGPRPELQRERLELPDGDFLDLDWTARTEGPLVLVLHGLEGSSGSPYARGILAAIHDAGWRGVLMHFRGCSEEPNRLARSYHSGETGDLAHVLGVLKTRYPETPLAAAGYSLGGNVLLKYLGEQGERAGIRCAVAVSVPFDLGRAADRLEQGLSRLYQWHLVGKLHRSLHRKLRLGRVPERYAGCVQLATFRAFDDQVTAPLHGFSGADDYYRRSSSRQYLKGIRVPTLILHARDDPFLPPDAIPQPRDLSPAVTLKITEKGGHVGFVSGPPWRPVYWSEGRIIGFLEGCLGQERREP